MENIDNNFWDDDKVIDFINWYLKLHNLDFRYNLENKTIIESFKNGDDVSKWKKINYLEYYEKIKKNESKNS